VIGGPGYGGTGGFMDSTRHDNQVSHTPGRPSENDSVKESGQASGILRRSPPPGGWKKRAGTKRNLNSMEQVQEDENVDLDDTTGDAITCEDDEMDSDDSSEPPPKVRPTVAERWRSQENYLEQAQEDAHRTAIGNDDSSETDGEIAALLKDRTVTVAPDASSDSDDTIVPDVIAEEDQSVDSDSDAPETTISTRTESQSEQSSHEAGRETPDPTQDNVFKRPNPVPSSGGSSAGSDRSIPSRQLGELQLCEMPGRGQRDVIVDDYSSNDESDTATESETDLHSSDSCDGDSQNECNQEFEKRKLKHRDEKCLMGHAQLRMTSVEVDDEEEEAEIEEEADETDDGMTTDDSLLTDFMDPPSRSNRSETSSKCSKSSLSVRKRVDFMLYHFLINCVLTIL